jgi:hypothetical protein
MAGPVRSVLLRLEVRPVGRRCLCAKKCGAVLEKGDLRLVVKESGPAAGEKGYCSSCATAMLEKAFEELGALKRDLRGDAPAAGGGEGQR